MHSEDTAVKIMEMIRTYSELLTLKSFKERYKYLQLDGKIGDETFGFERYLNQMFYKSKEWEQIRREVIIRDNGCDLAIDDYEIHGKILIHHMNPITVDDIVKRSSILLNPENLISTSLITHNAIHYGINDLLLTIPCERSKNDTCPWRH